ncbi:MAG: hypothetical protein H6895_01420 [Defluviimonas sp.]|nr:hypothetical protein [Defluviimonas sp.]
MTALIQTARTFARISRRGFFAVPPQLEALAQAARSEARPRDAARPSLFLKQTPQV